MNCDIKDEKSITEAQFVKVEMHGSDLDISAMDSSCDTPLNIDDFEEMTDEIENEIDIVVEEDGKITQISPEELATLKEGSFIEQDYLIEEIIQYSEDQTEKEKRDDYLDENLAEKVEKSYVCKACNT